MIPIGTIRSPFKALEGMPIQPRGAVGIPGTIELLPEFEVGLKDLYGFSHIILLYLFDRSEGFNLEVIPFMDTSPRGVFATRAPKRPNPIGLSVVELESVEETVLHIRNVDILDGTALLDVKPFVPEFDCPQDVRTGWIANSQDSVSTKKSDGRFK